MKKIINRFFHRIKEDSLLKKQGTVERSVEYRDLKSLKTCLVFWVANENQSAWLKVLGDRLKGVKMDKLCFVPDHIEILVTDGTVTMKNEDLAFGGKIRNKDLLELIEKKYDLLIDLSTVNNVLINYVLRNSRSRCKIGMKREGFDADIVIEGVTQQREFIDKMFEFLSAVGKC